MAMAYRRCEMTELPSDPPDDAAASVQHGMSASDPLRRTPAADPARLTAWVRGRVQGVGMRWWIRTRALELGLTGWARNLDDGRVEVVAQGSRQACDALLALLRGGRAPGRVEGVTERWSDPRPGLSDFTER
jgi:acylphosphatase